MKENLFSMQALSETYVIFILLFETPWFFPPFSINKKEPFPTQDMLIQAGNALNGIGQHEKLDEVNRRV